MWKGKKGEESPLKRQRPGIVGSEEQTRRETLVENLRGRDHPSPMKSRQDNI